LSVPSDTYSIRAASVAPGIGSRARDPGRVISVARMSSVLAARRELAGDREPVVVLTAPWHERETRRLVKGLGAPVFVPPPRHSR